MPKNVKYICNISFSLQQLIIEINKKREKNITGINDFVNYLYCNVRYVN